MRFCFLPVLLVLLLLGEDRGLLDALRLIQNGLSPYPALDMGLTNKTFDAYEQTLIRDIITTRISKKTESTTIFS